MPRALPPRDAKGRFCQRPTGEALPKAMKAW